MGKPHLSPLMTFGSHFTVALDLDSRVIGFKETLLIRNTKRLEFERQNFLLALTLECHCEVVVYNFFPFEPINVAPKMLAGLGLSNNSTDRASSKKI